MSLTDKQMLYIIPGYFRCWLFDQGKTISKTVGVVSFYLNSITQNVTSVHVLVKSVQSIHCPLPSKHTTWLQRRYNVAEKSRRCNDVDATLCFCWVIEEMYTACRQQWPWWLILTISATNCSVKFFMNDVTQVGCGSNATQAWSG